MKKLIIDTDCGLDDAQALLIALSNKDVDVVAITTCHGNVDVKQTSLNVLRTLKVVNRLDIPVYQGAGVSLIGRDCVNSAHYHGTDGLGDAPDPSAPGPDLIQKEPAALALSKHVRQHKGDLSLVCLGPLTNVALALRLDPDFSEHLKECVIMGGNYQGKGNITASAEFNFHADPEAAAVVLSQLTCDVTLVTWELCVKHTLSWSWFNEYMSIKTEKGRFIRTIEQNTLEKFYKNSEVTYDYSQRYCSADQLAMACFISPADFQLQRFYARVTVCTEGEVTLGRMVVLNPEMAEYSRNPSVVCIVEEVNHEMYGELLMKSLRD